MELDQDGLKFIESFEGWKKKLPDGRYCAYQDVYHGKLDKPTIGPGLTEGVLMGMIWTREECSAAFKKELAKHEAAITKMVTVDMSQHQFNALVSLSYNVGISAVRGSTALRKFNAGDTLGAAKAFELFSNVNKKPVSGLVRRRAAEAAMFLDPDGDDILPMPQAVTAAPVPVTATTAATGATVATTGLAVAAQVASVPSIPAVPPAVTNSIANASSWQSVGDQLVAFKATIAAAPFMFAGIAAVCAVLWFMPSLAAKLGGNQS
jgi:lysozyme